LRFRTGGSGQGHGEGKSEAEGGFHAGS
jgi:hypothetical protein